LSSEENSFEGVLGHSREFVSKIREEGVGKEPGPIELTGEEIEGILASDAEPPDQPMSTSELTIEGSTMKANEQMIGRDFGALVVAGPVRVLKKARMVFGRASPKWKPDVNVADLNLQSISRLHCTIALAVDLNLDVKCDGNSMIVNGSVFGKGSMVRLNDHDIIDYGGACFVFFENEALLEQLRSLKSRLIV
jgi:hypothetical protein